MNVSQFLKDYGEIISVTLIPILIFYVGKKLQDRDSKNQAKLKLFLGIMANRRKVPPSIDLADCLNQIDVVFQDNKKVRIAWRAYFDSLNPHSQHNANANSFFLDLLSEIANDLNYRDLKQTELDRFYRPQYYDDLANTQEIYFREYLRILQRSKNLAEPFSEEEYLEHIKNGK
ncbi:DUF6680 family protein [Pedobacter jejuensis]|uniref:DUF6680 domain-containing protein n=1 Tax=Pedobacter jejuensis TaxID=1268550 RepID=A0A3N0BN58_9SPHI|nr:DUF6680 family protein [Pedobacter jejuensis]RNL50162.1 hypothetical protein D7004_18285 [Pedobacter jejuensis]